MAEAEKTPRQRREESKELAAEIVKAVQDETQSGLYKNSAKTYVDDLPARDRPPDLVALAATKSEKLGHSPAKWVPAEPGLTHFLHARCPSCSAHGTVRWVTEITNSRDGRCNGFTTMDGDLVMSRCGQGKSHRPKTVEV